MGFLIILLLGICCAFYSANIVSAKGYDVGLWALGGFLLGPLALLAAVGLPDLKTQKYLRLLLEQKGIDIDATRSVAPSGDNADEQRRRILGGWNK
jgi:hypothetical protein